MSNFLLSIIGVFFCISLVSFSCTGISIKTQDKNLIQGRTIEYGESNLNSKIVISPKGKQYTSLTPDGQENGLKWNSKYGFVGATVVLDKFIGEGINEKGLNAGLFYFPHYGSLERYNQKFSNESIADMELVGWILSSFSSVDEVIEGLKNVKVVNIGFDEKGNPLPTAHWRVADSSGKNIVIEIINNGEVKIYENKVGVLTNSPDYPWHVKNLNNYVNLYTGNAPSFEVDDEKIFSFGAGTGALGLPGDITPPSRFVRAFFYLNSIGNPENSQLAVNKAFHILNNFDIPIEVEFPKEYKNHIPKDVISATQWTAVSDLNNKEFYYKTMYNSQIRKIDLKKIDFEKVKYQVLDMDTNKEENILEINVK
ncbi:MAG: choloylglycine hydrolase family protein [Fusobacterium perfoetens]|uniref:choloylglycine hydrolase family protein n=1 Tax=Fusobacterium perfoetens TaxID=852 RepID=UPI0023F0B41A|nr:choloylglycine hydrolase family protein [Fusobacterium perfoetens]MCI6153167.1 choloylglycine hydrolase family protein [Fusobacterium perfoetens]MDY3237097.1 choloylglycine hydrolase family protein [Fusobacterium perfoetens]